MGNAFQPGFYRPPRRLGAKVNGLELLADVPEAPPAPNCRAANVSAGSDTALIAVQWDKLAEETKIADGSGAIFYDGAVDLSGYRIYRGIDKRGIWDLLVDIPSAEKVLAKNYCEVFVYPKRKASTAVAPNTIITGISAENFSGALAGMYIGWLHLNSAYMHDIGKNIVGVMMQGAGIEVIDLGVNVPPENFVAAIKAHHPALVGMSALLTTTMSWMKKTMEVIAAAGVRSQVKVLVGGAPITQRFADEIGADGFSRDAAGAAVIAKELLARL